VAKAKAEIVDGMKPGDVLWLNARDRCLPVVLSQLEKKQALRRGLELAFFDTSAARDVSSRLPSLTLPGDSGDRIQAPSVDTSPSLWVKDVELKGLSGSRFMLCRPGECVPSQLKIAGCGPVANFTCATALCLQCGMSLEECADLGPHLEPVPQRLVPYELRPGVVLLDDSYNSSPASSQEALELIAQLPPETRRILVLGDMLELGKYETVFHRQIANQVFALPPSLVIAVGPRMAALQEVPAKNGWEVVWFPGVSDRLGLAAVAPPPDGDRGSHPARSRQEIVDDTTTERIVERVQMELLASKSKETVVLVKGSRALHLERVVRGVLALNGLEEKIL